MQACATSTTAKYSKVRLWEVAQAGTGRALCLCIGTISAPRVDSSPLPSCRVLRQRRQHHRKLRLSRQLLLGGCWVVAARLGQVIGRSLNQPFLRLTEVWIGAFRTSLSSIL